MRGAKALLMAMLVVPMGEATRLIDKENDDPLRIALDSVMEMNLMKIDSSSRRSVPLVKAPWSDVTWKANKGLVDERYGDPEFEKLGSWREKSAYLHRFSAASILRQHRSDRRNGVETLSPAEKYDLVLGLATGGLGDNIARYLDTELANEASFPSWWGLCEGSAASTMYYPEPTKKVVLHSEAYDIDVPFYATDIKGLATILWSRFNSGLVLPESGLQCRADGVGCFDTNPASFHAAVHHFLDLHPGVLVGDMDPSPVVWNFPLLAYSEHYYRPDRGVGHLSSDLQSAAIAAGDWKNDPRAAKRSPGTAYIVGVKLNLNYGVNQPGLPPREGSLKRKVNNRDLVYELELDSHWNLLGGEWVAGSHPDLLWSIPHGTLPNSPGDLNLSNSFPEGNSIPRAWMEAAKVSAAHLLPLRKVVELLIERSSGR